MNSPDSVLLRIRPSLPDQDEMSANRGPLMMEAVLSALHSLKGDNGKVGLEIGMANGKIGLFARGTKAASGLMESQFYAQFSDSEIEPVSPDLFVAKENEVVVSAELELSKLEMYPIKRYSQFIDSTTKQAVDTISGVTSSLVRYPKPGMRAHIQVVIEPLGSHYRKRAMKLLPLIGKGLPKMSSSYARLFTKAFLASGSKRLAYLPLSILMGEWKSWFAKNKISIVTGAEKAEGDDVSDKGLNNKHEREDKTAGAVDKLGRILFKTNVRISIITPVACARDAVAKLSEINSSFSQFTLPTSNGFSMREPKIYPQIPLGFQSDAFAMSSEEIATLWHIPSITVKTPNIDWVISKKLEPPVNLPVPGITDPANNLTILGESVFHGERMKFGIRAEDRMRHFYVIGKTGMGKSVLLQNMAFSDIHAGKGVAFIDPHGDLIDAILSFIPKERSNDVVLFDPADRDYPISFNILEAQNPDQRPLVASGLMSVFTKLWPEAFSGRMEHILRNTLLALLENEGQSMLGILRMYADDAYRAKIVENVQDPTVKSFWLSEYAGWTDKYRTEAVAAIQNKIGQLIATPLIRNITGQVRSTLNIREAMDTGKIVLVNLSKGKLGEDTSAFLGSMLVTKFQIEAMSRADIAEKDRRDFYLYVDEFQNFATKSFATILSEARKYRLSLTMAHQYVGQLTIGANDSSLKDAVFGNVGSMVSFQIGSEDAEDLSKQFEEMVSEKDILSLPKYHAYIRLMIDGVPSKPFSVGTLPPPKYQQDEGRIEKIRELSRERYSEKRAVVEEKIARWAAGAMEARIAAKQVEKSKEKEDEERKKARAKGMSLDEYRKWRDREMWANEYNALRKKKVTTPLTSEEDKKWLELEEKLVKTGGIPPPSKALQIAINPELKNAPKEAASEAPAAPAPTPAPKKPAPRPAPKPRTTPKEPPRQSEMP